MISISETFHRRAAEKRKALIPFLTAGFPDEKTFIRLLDEFAHAGADMIEIGIPFSDPLADGPAIQAASQQALAAGITTERTLQLLHDTNGNHPTPRIIMSYYNPIRAYGLPRFAKHASRAGVSGLIVPDLIWEEAHEAEHVCREHGLDLIHLLARTSPSARRRKIISRSTGFVYLVSVTGVTGVRQSFAPGLQAWIGKMKKESSLPVCVGFGISNPDQARSISRNADGIIIGSAIIDIINRAGKPRQIIKDIGSFIHRIRQGIDHA